MSDPKWYYRELDLPEFPAALKRQFNQLKFQLIQKPKLNYTKSTRDNRGYLNYLPCGATLLSSGITVPGIELIYSDLNLDFKNWYQHHISSKSKHSRFVTFNPPPGKPMAFMPSHCDMNRSYALNYVFDSGGPRIVVKWFREEGYPIVRGSQNDGGPSPESIHGSLHELASLTPPINRWYIVRTDIIHRVENIISPRILVTGDLDQSEVDRLSQLNSLDGSSKNII